MVNKLRYLLLVLTIFIGGCSTSIEGEHYVTMTPQLDLFRFFDSQIKGWGIVQDRSGNVIQRFIVDIKGSVKQNELVLHETFSYQLGEGPTTRTWRIERGQNGEYIGRANDITAPARGTSFGNAFNFEYKMDLPVGDDIYKVAFDDWFFAMDEQTIMNRSYIKKFGLVMAEVTIFMQQVD
ncbi:DUF3833 domain-containing protein [Alteromonas ponticola]|uniref:DUF3833 domain-containing protein n=2 Tax=Alteromonas aquimaris TaxID=2998417 RepID=A0ABT3P4F5_9ALTE|nr:DUF3833 domain-containing protein [Alteromonas aquimaris]MCW8106996.1 DUF3833 domain-containing protein [Alteromonas aquimaris]